MMWLQSVCQGSYWVYWSWNFLLISLGALDFDWQAEWIFTSVIFFWVITSGTFFCIYCTCLYLMHFGSPGFGISLLFLEAKAGKVSKLVASFTLIFLLDTEIPLCELYLCIWNIYSCFDVCSWGQTSSCGGFVLDNFHCHVSCDLIV